MMAIRRFRAWLASIISPDRHSRVHWTGRGTTIRERDRQFLILCMMVKVDGGPPEGVRGALEEHDAAGVLHYVDNHTHLTDAEFKDIRRALERNGYDGRV